MKIGRYAIHTMFLFGLWLGLGLQVQAQTDKVTYVYTDPQGTPLAEADAQGNIIARYDYAPYGTSVASLGSPPDGPGYTGHVNDPETGLVYMQARYYQPTGRFLSPDPMGPTPGNVFSFNRYAYVNNNPVNRLDPTSMYNCDTKNNKQDCEIIKQARNRIERARKSYAGRSPQAKALQKILDNLGTENDGNIVSIAFGKVDNAGSNAETVYDKNAGVLMKFDLNALKANFGNNRIEYAATLAHEGQHLTDELLLKRDPTPEVSPRFMPITPSG